MEEQGKLENYLTGEGDNAGRQLQQQLGYKTLNTVLIVSSGTQVGF